MGKFTTGLTEDDALDQFPSAANPLTALGIDPDEALANPEMLARMNPMAKQASTIAPVMPGVSAAGSNIMAANDKNDYNDVQKPAPVSASNAGKMGGAGDTPAAPATTTLTTTIPTTTSPVAPTPGVTKSGAPVPPSYDDYGRAGLDLLKQNLNSATSAANQIPTSNPDVDRLEATREKLATQPQLYSPTTGKMLDTTQVYNPTTGEMETINPKPTAGTRVWRGVRAGLTGLLTGGIRGGLLGAIDPAAAGSEAYGAPNKAFERAEEQRTAALGATDKTFGDTLANWKQAVDADRTKAGEFRSNATLGKDLTTGATGLLNADTDALKAQNDSPEAKAAAENAAKLDLDTKEFTLRSNRISDPKSVLSRMPASLKAYYLASTDGKLPDLRQPTEAEIATANATRMFTKQYGHPPQTMDELVQVAAAARGQFPNANQNKEADTNLRAAVKSAETHVKDLQETKAKMSVYGNAQDLKAIQDKIDIAQKQYDDLQNRLSGTDNSTPAATAQSTNTPPAKNDKSDNRQTPKGTPPPGATGTVLDSQGHLHWTNGKVSLGRAD